MQWPGTCDIMVAVAAMCRLLTYYAYILGLRETFMLIINGFKEKTETLATMKHPELCMNCRREVNHQIQKFSEYFTLFWVPLFPTNIKYTIRCPKCTYEVYIPKAMAKSYIENADNKYQSTFMEV